MSLRKGTSGGTCTFCGNTYSKREHYERHVRTHTRERPFRCAQCQSTFSRRDTLRRHIRACHPDSKDVAGQSAVLESGISGEPDDNPTLDVPPQDPQSSSRPFDGPLSASDLNRDSLIGGTFRASSTNADSTLEIASTDIAATAFPLDLVFNGSFDWSWDDSLSLDPSFSFEGLGTYDINHVSPSNPWLPLQSEPDRSPGQADSNDRTSHQWFTKMSNSRQGASIAPLPVNNTLGINDEISRDLLATSLQQRVPDTTLPSTQFMNRCIHIYITRLWPLMPVVHLPTFQPARCNPLLLLSICSLGALAIGSEQSLYHSERLFMGVHKAVLLTHAPSRPVDEHTLAVVQAATIGQTYALLSGSASNLVLAQTFHGTLSVMARSVRAALFASKLGTCDTSPSPKDWEAWIRVQTAHRLANAISVHNGEISAVVHQPSQFRFDPSEMRCAADDNLFLAKSAIDWASLMTRYRLYATTPHALFSNCAILECFVAEIGHRRANPFKRMKINEQLEDVSEVLLTWFHESSEVLGTDASQRLSLLMLWHSCFMMILSDINMFERICGRDGSGFSEGDMSLLRAWSLTKEAKCCVINALLICNLLERIRTSDATAVHVARVAWQAGLVLAIFSFFGRAEQNNSVQDPVVVCPELTELRKLKLYTESEWEYANQSATPERCRVAAFGLAATLRHVGPWPNAPSYVKTLDYVLNLLEPN